MTLNNYNKNQNEYNKKRHFICQA